VSDFFAHTQVTMIRWTHDDPVRRLQGLKHFNRMRVR
jgi:hypothetical protein